NLAQRTLTLIARNCGGELPAEAARTGADAELFQNLDPLASSVGEALDAQLFHLALETVFHSVRDANGYITQQQPWALRKTDPERMAAVLRHLHTALRTYGTVLQPFMPGSMGRLLDQLGVPGEARALAALVTPMPGGTPLPPPEPLFRKIDLAAA
ncbi:MAG TPA: methionine--tRNA ligase, partial [Acetobacteraceae bacterium]|nr:methionine--tRNA ligase [Acetobacteraceae bacterium]